MIKSRKSLGIIKTFLLSSLIYFNLSQNIPAQDLNPNPLFAAANKEKFVSYQDLMKDKRIQIMLKNSKDASRKEKIVTYGTGIWQSSKYPGLFTHLAMHEIFHSLASLVTRNGVEKFSVLPPLFSDRELKRQDLKQLQWRNIEDPLEYLSGEDYSKKASVYNYVFGGLRAISIAPMAYMEPKKPWREISKADKIGMLLAPYVADLATLVIADDIIGDAYKNADFLEPYEFDKDNIVLQHASGSFFVSLNGGLGGLFGIGDFALVAKEIIPPEKFNRWYHTIGRSLIAGSIGTGFATLDYKLFNRAVNKN